MTNSVITQSGIVVINGVGGHSVVAKGSPLRRVRFFDGQFLDASKLQLEQAALLNQVRISNQAGGAGVVHGYNCALREGDRLGVGPGLAIDPQGRLLLLGDDIAVEIDRLIALSRDQAAAEKAGTGAGGTPAFGDCGIVADQPPGTVLEDQSLYLITVSHMEGACGDEPVYGKLCEEACITSSERPYIIEGVVIRAVPLTLAVPLPTATAIDLGAHHLRSRVAAAYFEQERRNPASMISREGLASGIWCLGAEAEGGSAVPIAVLGRAGGTTLFLDAWTTRRERMQAPSRRYWAGRMAMRPWPVFLAQVLQFQCQLTRCFRTGPDKGQGTDPCAPQRKVAAQASEAVKGFLQHYARVAEHLASTEFLAAGAGAFEVADLRDLQKDLADVARAAVSQRMLIDCGLVELPSVGYLPVNPSQTLSVNEQVRRQVGEGLDLRFCVVRPDYVQHALEAAQHMERISLLQGLDDPSVKPRVDILVPDGRIERTEQDVSGQGYTMDLQIGGVGFALAPQFETPKLRTNTALFAAAGTTLATALRQVDRQTMQGAARGEELDTGGYAFYYAGLSEAASEKVTFARDLAAERPLILRSGAAEERLVSGLGINAAARPRPWQAIWTKLRIERDPFTLARGQSTHISGTVVLVIQAIGKEPILAIEEINLHGLLTAEDILESGAKAKLKARLDADGAMRTRRRSGADEVDRTNPLELSDTVFVQRQPTPGVPAAIVVTVPNPSPWAWLGHMVLTFERSWKTPQEAVIGAFIQLGSSGKAVKSFNVMEMPVREAAPGESARPIRTAPTQQQTHVLFRGRQQENDDVLQPGHALHSASLEALKRIESALQDKNFADVAARQLFAPPAPVPDALRVFATRHWVLFHRHRDIQCDYALRPPAAIRPRRYRVFHASLAKAGDIDELTRALEANDTIALAQFELRPVTLITYEAGVQSLLTSPLDVRADWQQRVLTDADIVFGVIASGGAARDEGETLALARLDSLAQVLGPVTELAPGADLVAVGEVPDTIASGEIDGAIVLATLEIATICHQPYRLEITNAQLKRLLEQIDGNNFAALLEEFGARPMSPNVKFRSGTTNLFGEQAADQFVGTWQAAANGAVTATINIAHTSIVGASEAEGQPVRGQAARLATTVGTAMGPDDVQPVVTDITLPACPAITVLATEPRIEVVCNDVNYMMMTTKTPDETLALITRMIVDKNQGYPAVLEVAKKDNILLDTLTIMDFNAGTADTTPEFLEALQEAWQALKFTSDTGELPEAVIPRVVAISRQGADPATRQANLRQAQFVREQLKLTSDVEVVEVMNGPDFLPSNCLAVTLIYLAVQFQLNAIARFPGMVATETADGETSVTGLERSLRFDATGTLVRDSAFEAGIEELKRTGRKLSGIEFITLGDAADAPDDPRAKELLKVLKEAGVAKTRATLKFRTADVKEREIIKRLGGGKVTGGFVFRR